MVPHNNLAGVKSSDLPITEEFLKYSYEDEEEEANEARTNEEMYDNKDLEKLAQLRYLAESRALLESLKS